jgi:hypothetical protein
VEKQMIKSLDARISSKKEAAACRQERKAAQDGPLLEVLGVAL